VESFRVVCGKSTALTNKKRYGKEPFLLGSLQKIPAKKEKQKKKKVSLLVLKDAFYISFVFTSVYFFI